MNKRGFILLAIEGSAVRFSAYALPLFSTMGFVAHRSVRAQARDGERYAFQLQLERSQLIAERRRDATGLELTTEPEVVVDPCEGCLPTVGFAQAVAVVAAVSVAWIVGRIIDDWLKDREQGVQIDLRLKPPRISRVAGVPRGVLLTIQPDGKQVSQEFKYVNSNDLTALLIAAVGAAPK